jgi:hypothetical protein
MRQDERSDHLKWQIIKDRKTGFDHFGGYFQGIIVVQFF